MKDFKEVLEISKELISQLEKIDERQINLNKETTLDLVRDSLESLKIRFNKIEPKKYRSFTKKLLVRRLNEIMSFKTDSLLVVNIEPLKYALNAYEKVYGN